jgi:transposase
MVSNNYLQGKRGMKLPVMVSRADFNKYIDPYLSRGTREPKTKISRYRIFNYIVYVLHTGMQWNQLKVNRKAVHWSNIYRWHNKWSKDGSYKNLFETSVMFLKDNDKLDLSVIHGDGSNTIAKKGVKISDILGINIRKV